MKRVMFVCKKNSARSQMAEGFAKTLGKGTIEVTSSGLEASQVRPEAIATMKERNPEVDTDRTGKAFFVPKDEIKANGYDRKKGLSSLPFQRESSKKFAEFQAGSFQGGANPKSKIQNPKSGDLSINRYKEVEYDEVKYEHPKVLLQKLRTLKDEIQADLDALEGLLG